MFSVLFSAIILNTSYGWDFLYDCNGVTWRVEKIYGGCRIGAYNHNNVKNIVVPDTIDQCSVTELDYGAFVDVVATQIVLNASIKAMGQYSFSGCKALQRLEIPPSVAELNGWVFYNCPLLTEVVFKGDSPNGIDVAMENTVPYCKILVDRSAKGWGNSIPGTFAGRCIDYIGDADLTTDNTLCITITNIVVHFVTNSMRPEFMKLPIQEVGFVNVITEVKGNNVAVPATWAANYPKFATSYGSDFTKALTMKTGKIAAGGREMLVWEDYVTGTDPTDPNDKFTASMTMVDGKPVISWTPELDAARAAMRKYTTYGKVKLTDSEWTVVPEGRASDYNFFKVTVEMK